MLIVDLGVAGPSLSDPSPAPSSFLTFLSEMTCNNEGLEVAEADFTTAAEDAAAGVAGASLPYTEALSSPRKEEEASSESASPSLIVCCCWWEER